MVQIVEVAEEKSDLVEMLLGELANDGKTSGERITATALLHRAESFLAEYAQLFSGKYSPAALVKYLTDARKIRRDSAEFVFY